MDNTFVKHAGVDESGKGDFFGPLVIAGVLVDEKNSEIFKLAGIRDSKTLSDKKIIEFADIIQQNSVNSVIAISNGKYNQLYKSFANLNKLLAWGHAKTIENLLEKAEFNYAISDKFGNESLILNALQTKGRGIKLEQMVRAESDIGVAAASVLARATFVKKMQQMETQWNCKFPKGASALVKTAGADFIHKHGEEKLNEVCKTHFKTYKEIL